MFGLFKSKKQKFVDGANSYLTHLITLAEQKDALSIYSGLIYEYIGDDINHPDVESFYNTESQELELICYILKHKCILAILTKEVGLPKRTPLLSILSRKRKTLVVKDDYGDYIFDKWRKELDFFCESKLSSGINDWLHNTNNIKPFIDNIIYGFNHIEDGELLSDLLIELPLIIDEFISIYDDNNEIDTSYDETMSGHEYEFYVAEQFENQGFNAQVTKGSGDHGVDVLVEYDNAKIGRFSLYVLVSEL